MMMIIDHIYSITLYSTDCSKCKILEKKLNERDIYFTKVSGNDAIEEIKKAGYLEAPVMNLNGKYLPFKDAVEWVNTISII